MCYSVESSVKTSALSLFAIIYLLLSGNPHFKWLAIALLGWCLMQFAELLLWLTDPRSGCTDTNKLITLTLIPLALALQPLGFLFGSLYAIPWAKSSDFRKHFIVWYSVFILALVYYMQYYKPQKLCTTVTEKGHLYWYTDMGKTQGSPINIFGYFVWFFLLVLPIFLFWNKSYLPIFLIILLPLYGFLNGFLDTDSRSSIWCYYTSYDSVLCSVMLLLKQMGIYNVLV